MFTYQPPLRFWKAVSAVVLCVVTPATAVTDLNLELTFADIRSRIAAGESTDMLILGDSLSFRQGTYLPELRDRLQAEFGDGGTGYLAFAPWTGAQIYQWLNTPDPAWTIGRINTDTEPHQGLDGMWATSSSPLPDGLTSASIQASSDLFELHYLVQPGGGTFSIALPGGGQAVIDTASETREVRTWSYTFTGDNRKLTFQPDGTGPVTILGRVEEEVEPGIVLHRVANGGWGVDNYLARDETFDEQLSLIHPDVVAVWLGQNDQGYDPSTFRDMVNQLVDRIRLQLPESQVLLIGTYDSGSDKIGQLVGVFEEVAATRSLGFINLYELGGDYKQILRSGYLDDGLHFSELGGEYFSELLFDRIVPVMMPAWSDVDADGFVGFSDWNKVMLNAGKTVTPGDRGEGDLNGDGMVDDQDLALIARHWNESAVGVPMLTGDVNRDGTVGLDDLDQVLTEWYVVIQSVGGDIDDDGFVGLDDLMILLQQWNQSAPPGGSLSGDLDGDGLVGLLDLDIILLNWNLDEDKRPISKSDMNGDGIVGLDELDLVLKYWGQSTNMASPPSDAVPEPGASLLLIPCLAAGLGRRGQ